MPAVMDRAITFLILGDKGVLIRLMMLLMAKISIIAVAITVSSGWEFANR